MGSRGAWGPHKTITFLPGQWTHLLGELGRVTGKGAYLVVPVALAVTLWGRERGGESVPHSTPQQARRASLGPG